MDSVSPMQKRQNSLDVRPCVWWIDARKHSHICDISFVFFPLLLNKISSRLWLLFNHLRNRASNWLDNWASMRFPRLCTKKKVHKAPCKVYGDIWKYDLLYKNKTVYILLENSMSFEKNSYLRCCKANFFCKWIFKKSEKMYTLSNFLHVIEEKTQISSRIF